MHSSSTLSSSAGQAGTSVFVTPDWTCPFCPLHCDDIAATVHADESLSAPATDCPRLAAGLARYGAADASCKPAIDGQDTDLDSALARATEILAQARRPLFGGLATDIAGMRSLYELASGCGAILDHLHGDAQAASTLALQDRGAFFTTLSEVRSRADLVVVFACQPSSRYPRFYERVLGGTSRRQALCFVGCDADPAATLVAQAGISSILAGADLYDVLALWSALLEGRTVEAMRDDSGIARELPLLIERIAASPYAAFVYEPAALPGPHAALLIEALNRIIKAVNRTTRAGGLPLGGDDGALSANQTLTWLSGFPLRTRVATPARRAGEAPLEHDPYRYQTAQLLADQAIDALLWISAFGPEPLPETLDPNVPAIVLGHPALARSPAGGAGGGGGNRRAPAVYIPVATTGIDSSGHLFRVDGSVVVPLRAARKVGLPTVAMVAALLSGRLEEARRSVP